MSISVLAKIVAREDKVDQLKELLENLARASRQEEGNLKYNILQNLADPSHFSTVEEWRDQAAIESHFQTPHLQEAFAAAENLLAAAPEIINFKQLI